MEPSVREMLLAAVAAAAAAGSRRNPVAAPARASPPPPPPPGAGVTASELDNEAIARRLADYGALLELAGAGYYSQRAYRRAADLIRSTPAPIAELVRAGRVRELRGIGPSIEARLREICANSRK